MFKCQKEWVILGVTEFGEVFDVPGWAERLCDLALTEGSMPLNEGRELLRPLHIDGLQAVLVQTSLQQCSPLIFKRVCEFVKDNHLKTRAGRTSCASSDWADGERRKYERG